MHNRSSSNTHIMFNSLKPVGAQMRQWTGSSLVHVMTCRLCSAQPLPEPMLTNCQLDHNEYISKKLYLKFKSIHSRNAFENVCEIADFCYALKYDIMISHYFFRSNRITDYNIKFGEIRIIKLKNQPESNFDNLLKLSVSFNSYHTDKNTSTINRAANKVIYSMQHWLSSKLCGFAWHNMKSIFVYLIGRNS